LLMRNRNKTEYSNINFFQKLKIILKFNEKN